MPLPCQYSALPALHICQWGHPRSTILRKHPCPHWSLTQCGCQTRLLRLLGAGPLRAIISPGELEPRAAGETGPGPHSDSKSRAAWPYIVLQQVEVKPSFLVFTLSVLLGQGVWWPGKGDSVTTRPARQTPVCGARHRCAGQGQCPLLLQAFPVPASVGIGQESW